MKEIKVYYTGLTKVSKPKKKIAPILNRQPLWKTAANLIKTQDCNHSSKEKKKPTQEMKTSAFGLYWKTLKNNIFCSVVMHLVLIAEWTKLLRLQSHRSPQVTLRILKKRFKCFNIFISCTDFSLQCNT